MFTRKSTKQNSDKIEKVLKEGRIQQLKEYLLQQIKQIRQTIKNKV